MSASSSSADRNLLFGILAVQVNFLTRDALIQGMNAWVLQKHRPLGEILVEQGALPANRRDMLEAMVAEHLQLHANDTRRSLAALSLVGSARQDLARVADADVQASVGQVGADSWATECPLPPPTDHAVRFRRLRTHARGGLGEVFVALDEELRREVALKEIQERFADHPDSRARLVREAEITGHLEHPGVVAVYGLGAYANGRPFYAMRFIHGESLHEAIARFHQAGPQRNDVGERRLAMRELLGRFVAVCNAVAYAHSRGVIHRDLKPGNVMLGEYGETLVVDWGLARLIHRDESEATTASLPVRLSAGNGAAPTEMGQVVGTPAYMPPEQAAGNLDALGPASDVFALGAILYHLLTGDAPYRGTSSQQVLEQARRCQVAPARQRRADVPRPLEAICARAMAASPKARYTGARSLAEEVRRFLDDEPVQAYREPLADQVRRWGRRHRTLVSVGVALLLAGVVALGVGLWRVNTEKDKTAQQRDRAVEAEEQAQANLKLAREAIDECYNVAYEDPLFQGARMESARNLLLRKTLDFYKNFRVQIPDDRGLQHEEAQQWFRVGHIEEVLQRSQHAKEAYERARHLYQALVQTHPDMPEYQKDLALTHNCLGNLLKELGKHEEALSEYREAHMLRQKLIETHPHRPEYKQALARTHHNLGILLAALGKRAEALVEYRRARLLKEKLVQTHPDVPEYQNDLANTHNGLGALLRSLGKRDEALAEFRQAHTLRQKLFQKHPDLPEYQQYLAVTLSNLGAQLSDLGERDEALAKYQQAGTLQQKLVQTHPDLPLYQRDLAATHNNLGNLLSDLGKREQALKEYRQALALRQKLVQTHPERLVNQRDLADTHNNLGSLLSTLGQREEAMADYQEALTLQQKLIKAYPDVLEYGINLAGTYCNIGTLLRDTGKARVSLSHYSQAIDLLQAIHRRAPDDATAQLFLRNSHLGQTGALTALGRQREADADWDQAIRLDTGAARTFCRLQRADSRVRAGDYLRSAAEAGELAAKDVSAEDLYNLACVHALSAVAAAKDAARPLPEREKRAEQYARAAVELLKRVATAGYFRDRQRVEHLDVDEDLAGLRDRDDYRALRKTLAAKPAAPR